MTKNRLISGLAVAALLLLPGCPGSNPDSAGESGPAPTDIATIAIAPSSITLNAPATNDADINVNAPGGNPNGGIDIAGLDTASYLTVTATLHNGTTQKLGEVKWVSSHPSLVSVNGEGLAKALNPGTKGQVTITATHKDKVDLKAEAVITLVNDGGAAVEIE